MAFLRVTDVASPCIKICQVDPLRRICNGCLRTLDEIGGWTTMGAGERAWVMADLPRRRQVAPPAVVECFES